MKKKEIGLDIYFEKNNEIHVNENIKKTIIRTF